MLVATAITISVCLLLVVLRGEDWSLFCGYYGIDSYENQVYIDLLAIYYGFKMPDEEKARYIEVESDTVLDLISLTLRLQIRNTLFCYQIVFSDM